MKLFGFVCQHRHTFIERRELPGTKLAVLHFVCEDCGHAAPMMRRSIEEHEHILQIGAIKPAVVMKTTK